MKELNVIIRPEMLETTKSILIDEFKCGGMTVLNAMGCGNQQGFQEEFTGIRTHVNLLPKLKIEVYVKDADVETIVDTLCKKLNTGHVGSGKIIIKNVEDAIRIRTTERGDSAI